MKTHHAGMYGEVHIFLDEIGIPFTVFFLDITTYSLMRRFKKTIDEKKFPEELQGATLREVTLKELEILKKTYEEVGKSTEKVVEPLPDRPLVVIGGEDTYLVLQKTKEGWEIISSDIFPKGGFLVFFVQKKKQYVSEGNITRF